MIPLSGSEWGIVRFPALDVSPVKEARAPLPPARQVGGRLGAKMDTIGKMALNPCHILAPAS
jgi:hypothetical protein